MEAVIIHLSTFFLHSKGPRTCSFCLKVWIKQVNYYLIEDAISSSQNPSPKDDKFRCQAGIYAWDNGLWTTTSQNFIRRKGENTLFLEVHLNADTSERDWSTYLTWNPIEFLFTFLGCSWYFDIFWRFGISCLGTGFSRRMEQERGGRIKCKSI